jgi:hypothetical protein
MDLSGYRRRFSDDIEVATDNLQTDEQGIGTK